MTPRHIVGHFDRAVVRARAASKARRNGPRQYRQLRVGLLFPAAVEMIGPILAARQRPAVDRQVIDLADRAASTPSCPGSLTWHLSGRPSSAVPSLGHLVPGPVRIWRWPRITGSLRAQPWASGTRPKSGTPPAAPDPRPDRRRPLAAAVSIGMDYRLAARGGLDGSGSSAAPRLTQWK